MIVGESRERRRYPAAMVRHLLPGLLALGLAACGGEETTAPPGPDYPEFPDHDWEADAATLAAGPDWYRHAVFYEVFVRSLQDSDGDGIGWARLR